MRVSINLTIWILLNCALINSVFAQKDSTYVGNVRGVVKDSIANSIIQSATVAIYKTSDSSLIKYTLTNNFGEFALSNIPYNTNLFLTITSDGYNSAFRKFIIPKDVSILNLDILNLERNAKDKIISLNEVVIRSIAPVKIKGDTIEFYADAFKLDPNAVVDDLMRQLTGVTIWSDGEITINGKKISQVLVGGKPFFGGDPKMALQNLPKSSVEKIQFYNSVDDKNASDSSATMNIQLKDNRKIGAFGKLSLGIGTNYRNNIGGMLNSFTKRTQVGIVGSSNNINNLATDVHTLMNYNFFKPIGVNIDYEPDFNAAGVTNSQSSGFTIQHDFVDNPTTFLSNRINANYFMTRKNQDIDRSLITTSLIDNNSLKQYSVFNTNNYQLKHIMESSYNNKNAKIEYYFKPTAIYNKVIENSKYTNTVITDLAGLVSRSDNNNDDSFTTRNISFKTGFRTLNINNKNFKGIKFDYEIENLQNDGNRNLISDFSSLTQDSRLRSINRRYLSHSNDFNNQFILELNKVNEMLLDGKKILGITFGIVNKLGINQSSRNDNVSDFDRNNEVYRENEYLTNSFKTLTINYSPSLDFYKNSIQSFSDRFKKSLDVKMSLGSQFIEQENVSDAAFQNFNRSYRNFMPQFFLSYIHHKFGTYERKYSLQYLTKVSIPQPTQIAALIDSSDVYIIQLGNSQLREQFEHSFVSSYSNRSEGKVKSNYYYELTFKGGFIKDKISDSVSYDTFGRRTVTPVNLNGYKFLNANFLLQNSIKLSKEKNIQFSFSSNFRISKAPIFINEIFSISENMLTSHNLNVSYEVKSFTLNLTQGYQYFNTKQMSNTIVLTNTVFETIFGLKKNFSKIFSLTSNINFKRNLNNTSPNESLAIWNIVGTVRFLPKNNGELKFSALDLLRQNRSLINYASENMMTTGFTNALRNYYMITLSYYPRFFGKEIK